MGDLLVDRSRPYRQSARPQLSEAKGGVCDTLRVDVVPEAWDDLFVAAAGASAALGGLLFVAMSINVREIVALPGVAARAAEAIVFAVAPLVLSMVVLMPGQSLRAVGVEVLVVGLVAWAIPLVLQLRWWGASADQPTGKRVGRVVLAQVASAGAPVAGVMLVTGNDDGLYALAVGITLSFVLAVLNGWVLLIEILR
jgi:hypothetical protein